MRLFWEIEIFKRTWRQRQPHRNGPRAPQQLCAAVFTVRWAEMKGRDCLSSETRVYMGWFMGKDKEYSRREDRRRICVFNGVFVLRQNDESCAGTTSVNPLMAWAYPRPTHRALILIATVWRRNFQYIRYSENKEISIYKWLMK